MITWGELAGRAPELASFGADRLAARPAYLATLRRDGKPRVHPVTPVLTLEGLFLFMEPTSPKGRDLEERGWYALHNGVPDNEGSGGEFLVAGRGVAVDDPAVWEVVADSAGYPVMDRYVLFELMVGEARSLGYGDTALPTPPRWPVP